MLSVVEYLWQRKEKQMGVNRQTERLTEKQTDRQTQSFIEL